MKRKLYTIVLLFFSQQLFAQKNAYISINDETIFKSKTNYGWVTFNEGIAIKPEQLFVQYANAFGLTNGFTMQLLKKSDAVNGYSHYKFNEYYNGIKIENADYNVHTKNGYLTTANGDIYTGKISSKVAVTEANALKAALIKTNAKEYYWQNKQREDKIKLKKKDANATYYPKAEKVYLYDEKTTSLLLVFKFVIQTIDAGKSNISFVDVLNGNVIKQLPLQYFCDPTTVVTNWYGTQPISTNDVGLVTNSYDLEDDCQASVYQINDAENGNSVFNGFTLNNNWNSTTKKGSAATSLWTIKQTYNTFKTFFNRDGHDNDGGNIDVYQGFVFSGNNANNAAFQYDPGGDDEVYIGTGTTTSTLDDWNTLDIMAHEFTHGVTQYEANLIYSAESGALNESFSDIFGEWVESKFRSPDWLIGNDRTGGAIRSFINPANNGDPNTYLGTSWMPTNAPCDTTNDVCGVHTNSGVQNKMFYLLSQGGSGWNNGLTSSAPVGNGTPYNVSGIGINTAAGIAYQVLCNYLNSGSNYFAARSAWVQAAIALYGECSNEAIQVGKAWAAVGIGPPTAANYLVACTTYGTSASYYYEKTGPVYLSTSNLNPLTYCNTTISTSGNLVQFVSGKKVVLNPGFKALNGSRFTAKISDCNFAAY